LLLNFLFSRNLLFRHALWHETGTPLLNTEVVEKCALTGKPKVKSAVRVAIIWKHQNLQLLLAGVKIELLGETLGRNQKSFSFLRMRAQHKKQQVNSTTDRGE